MPSLLRRPSPLRPIARPTHLNCINNEQSKKFNDCRCRHLSLLAERCLRPRPPHQHQHQHTHARTHAWGKPDRWRVKFMGRRQSDRNLSLNAVRLSNAAPSAMDAADMQRMRNFIVAVAACCLQLLIKYKFCLQAETMNGLCVGLSVRLSAHAACQHASSLELGSRPFHAAYAQCVCTHTILQAPSALNLTTVK